MTTDRTVRKAGFATGSPCALAMAGLLSVGGVAMTPAWAADQKAPVVERQSRGETSSVDGGSEALRKDIHTLEMELVVQQGRMERLRQLLSAGGQVPVLLEEPALTGVQQALHEAERQLLQARITYVDGHQAIVALEQKRQVILEQWRQGVRDLLEEARHQSVLRVQQLALRERQLLALNKPKPVAALRRTKPTPASVARVVPPAAVARVELPAPPAAVVPPVAVARVVPPAAVARVELPAPPAAVESPAAVARVESSARIAVARVESSARIAVARVEPPAPAAVARVEPPAPAAVARVEPSAPVEITRVEPPAAVAHVEPPAPVLVVTAVLASHESAARTLLTLPDRGAASVPVAADPPAPDEDAPVVPIQVADLEKVLLMESVRMEPPPKLENLSPLALSYVIEVPRREVSHGWLGGVGGGVLAIGTWGIKRIARRRRERNVLEQPQWSPRSLTFGGDSDLLRRQGPLLAHAPHEGERTGKIPLGRPLPLAAGWRDPPELRRERSALLEAVGYHVSGCETGLPLLHVEARPVQGSTLWPQERPPFLERVLTGRPLAAVAVLSLAMGLLLAIPMFERPAGGLVEPAMARAHGEEAARTAAAPPARVSLEREEGLLPGVSGAGRT